MSVTCGRRVSGSRLYVVADRTLAADMGDKVLTVYLSPDGAQQLEALAAKVAAECYFFEPYAPPEQLQSLKYLVIRHPTRGVPCRLKLPPVQGVAQL